MGNKSKYRRNRKKAKKQNSVPKNPMELMMEQLGGMADLFGGGLANGDPDGDIDFALPDLDSDEIYKQKTKIFLEEGAILPTRAYERASGSDLYAQEEVTVEPWKTAKVPTGVHVALGPGCEMQVRPRSGLSLKTSMMVANSPGTIDSDYRGSCDVIVRNLSDQPLVITKGMKIAQLVLCPVFYPDWDQVETLEELDETERGEKGWGSSGVAEEETPKQKDTAPEPELEPQSE